MAHLTFVNVDSHPRQVSRPQPFLMDKVLAETLRALPAILNPKQTKTTEMPTTRKTTNQKVRCNACSRLVGGGQRGMQQHIASHNSAPKPQRKVNNRPRVRKAPVNESVAYAQPGPTFSNASDGSARIRHAEVITLSFPAKATEAVATLPLKFGSDLPWLSQVLVNYDKIQWNNARLDWKPLVPTTVGGDVIIYFDTQNSDSSPATYKEAYNAQGARSHALWDKFTHTATKQDLRAQKEYAADGTNTGNLFGTPGNYQIYATRNGADSSETVAVPAGRLYFHYDVTLIKPEQPKPATLVSLVTMREASQQLIIVETLIKAMTDNKVLGEAICPDDCTCNHNAGGFNCSCKRNPFPNCIVAGTPGNCVGWCPCGAYTPNAWKLFPAGPDFEPAEWQLAVKACPTCDSKLVFHYSNGLVCGSCDQVTDWSLLKNH